MTDINDGVKKKTSAPHVERARKNYDKGMSRLEAVSRRRDKFLESNDKRLKSLRDLDEMVLQKSREQHDKKIKERRDRIEKSFVKDDKVKKERLDSMIEKTDRKISKIRSSQDKRRKKHQHKVDSRRRKKDERVARYFKERRIILENRLRNAENDDDNVIGKTKALTISIGAVCLLLIFVIMQLVMPGSIFRRSRIKESNEATETDAAVVSDEFDDIIEDTLKPEKTYSDMTEQQRLYSLLMEHFNGNKTAVLGVMCNLWSESRFESFNLEDYNNQIWAVDDYTYTDNINTGAISRKDFLEARTYNMTNGYLNGNNEWVNRDGGYGYAQYTAYTKKESLYQFAEQWFGPGGEGDGYRFNIGDPDMQAHYVIYLLDSNEFATLDSRIMNAGSVVDACYYWLRFYEVPYDPYCDNYYTLAFDRAAKADEIEAECAGQTGE